VTFGQASQAVSGQCQGQHELKLCLQLMKVKVYKAVVEDTDCQ